MWHEPTREQPSVVLTGVSSDSHTWNLVFLQLLIAEHGCRVTNLGPAVPADLLVAECLRIDPDLVVVSTVNGHGAADGLAAIAALRAEPRLADTPWSPTSGGPASRPCSATVPICRCSPRC
jgi:methylaspartate mutase sigma subunit